MKTLNLVSLSEIKERLTPYYYYDLGLLRRTLDQLLLEAGKYNFQIHYALKANTDTKVLETINNYKLGADCVSGNEILKAIECGFPVQKIMFAGVGKTDKEIETGIKNNIACFNCESDEEIQVINSIARKLGKEVNIAIRINPDIVSETHDYITTGRSNTKFGILFSQLENSLDVLNDSEHIKLIGLHFHIGSQITNMDVFKNLCVQVNRIENWFYQKGINILMINLGGGLGIDYQQPDLNPIPDFKVFFRTIYENLQVRVGQKVHFELGRAIVGQMGNLISRALYTKQSGNTHFAIIDAGMTELIRPALYQSYHKIENLTKSINRNTSSTPILYDVVGPICETSDFLGKKISLPKTERGDLLAIRSVGAYAQSMSSNYNLREKANVYYSE